MGRYCIVCQRGRPNEHFGGKGRRRVICKGCRKLPKEVLELQLATDEVYGFLDQSNISATNIKRLNELARIGDPTFQRLRSLILEIGRIHPLKRRRWKNLNQKHRELFDRIQDSQFFDFWFDDFNTGLSETEEIEDYDDDVFKISADNFEQINVMLLEEDENSDTSW
jgi:hypothetical protein